jgi:hypothetical protein
VLAQVRDLEPLYAVTAALLGLLTAVLTYFFTRPSEAPSSGPTSSRGPVIGDLDQSGGYGQAARQRSEDLSRDRDANGPERGGPGADEDPRGA